MQLQNEIIQNNRIKQKMIFLVVAILFVITTFAFFLINSNMFYNLLPIWIFTFEIVIFGSYEILKFKSKQKAILNLILLSMILISTISVYGLI